MEEEGKQVKGKGKQMEDKGYRWKRKEPRKRRKVNRWKRKIEEKGTKKVRGASASHQIFLWSPLRGGGERE